MKYCKIANGVVKQVQPYMEEGFIDCPDSVVCDMLYDGVSYSIPDKTPEQIKEEYIASGEKITEEHINEPIEAYNQVHGVRFDNVHNCCNYKDSLAYPHHIFCGDVWLFNVECWMVARRIQDDISLGLIPQPTEAEFKAMLPVYTGAV